MSCFFWGWYFFQKQNWKQFVSKEEPLNWYKFFLFFYFSCPNLEKVLWPIGFCIFGRRIKKPFEGFQCVKLWIRFISLKVRFSSLKIKLKIFYRVFFKSSCTFIKISIIFYRVILKLNLNSCFIFFKSSCILFKMSTFNLFLPGDLLFLKHQLYKVFSK